MISKENKRIKIGFLGGAINSAAGYAHYSAIRLVNHYDLVAGCFSRHQEINIQAGSHYLIDSDRVYDTFETLIEKEKDKLDALVILTPTDQHAQQVIICIKNGVPVICEKALSCSLQQIHAIQQAIELHNGFLAVIYNYLGYPVLREMKFIIAQGRLGNLHHIQIEMPQEGFNRLGANEHPVLPQSWRLHDGQIPTLSLDLGVHLHMIVKYLTGEMPLNVMGISQSYGNFKMVKDNISSIIEYTNDVTCNMWYSKIATGNRNGLSIRIYGEKGSAEWVQENPECLKLADKHGRRWTIDRGSNEAEICNQARYARFKAGHPSGFIEAFANYYDDIAEDLFSYQQNKFNYSNQHSFGIQEACEGMYLLDAIAASSNTRTWQKVTFKPK